jgi:hypothetical protein
VAALVVGGGLRYLTNRYGGTIERAGTVFAGLDEGSRPAAPSDATGGVDAPAPQADRDDGSLSWPALGAARTSGDVAAQKRAQLRP